MSRCAIEHDGAQAGLDVARSSAGCSPTLDLRRELVERLIAIAGRIPELRLANLDGKIDDVAPGMKLDAVADSRQACRLSVYSCTLTFALSRALAASTSTSASTCATSLLTSRWRMAKSAMRTLSHASSRTGRQMPLVTKRGPQSQPYS